MNCGSLTFSISFNTAVFGSWSPKQKNKPYECKICEIYYLKKWAVFQHFFSDHPIPIEEIINGEPLINGEILLSTVAENTKSKKEEIIKFSESFQNTHTTEDTGMKKCGNCKDLVSLNNHFYHERACKRYADFIKKTATKYQCKLCWLEIPLIQPVKNQNFCLYFIKDAMPHVHAE